MIRSRVFCLTLTIALSSTVASAETFLTTEVDYTLGENSSSHIAVFQQTDTSNTYAYGSGWALDRAHPEDLLVAIEEGYSNATIKGIYVKPCESDVWDSIVGTKYDIQDEATESQDGANYLFDIYKGWNSAEPAGTLNDTYACGGSYARYQTYTGYQSVRTGGTVTFAYVVEFNNGSNTVCSDNYIAGAQYNSGEVVNNNGVEYQCLVGGWCSQGDSAGWAYEPGAGLYWTQAWQEIGACQ